MLKFVSLLFLSAVALAAPANSAAKVVELETTGYARELDSGELVYSEHHRFLLDAGHILEHAVEYRDAQGKAFAHKSLDYSEGRHAPAFRLEDSRDGYVEGGEYRDGVYHLYRRKAADQNREVKAITGHKLPLVSDAGFNTYMIDNMATLASGEKVRIELCVAGRLASYAFRAHKSADRKVLGRPAVEVTTEPNSALLRFLVDPLKIAYDRETSRLLVFEGTTNIRDASGERYIARIEFPPDEVVITPVSE